MLWQTTIKAFAQDNAIFNLLDNIFTVFAENYGLHTSVYVMFLFIINTVCPYKITPNGGPTKLMTHFQASSAKLLGKV